MPRSSVKETNVGFDLVPAMLSKRVTATLGAYWNVEAVQLAQQRKRPHVIRMEQVGVPTYDELILVARKDTLARRGDDVRAFVQALARGYAAARADPQAATDALVRAAPDLNRRFALASVKASLPAFFPASGKPWGWQSTRRVERVRQMDVREQPARRRPACGLGRADERVPGGPGLLTDEDRDLWSVGPTENRGPHAAAATARSSGAVARSA